MKIYEDVLPPKLLKKCIEELKSFQQSEVWGISNFFWQEELQVGLVGNVSTTPLPEESALKIHEVLNKYFSKMGSNYEVTYQYYIWNKMAGIASHDDGNYGAGATLYLNETWDPNWGGLFVWQDKDEKKGYKFNAICPKQNMLIINDECEWHLVTSTSPTIPHTRITIQMWYAQKGELKRLEEEFYRESQKGDMVK